MEETAYGKPLRERPADTLFVAAFALFAASSFLFDLPRVLGDPTGVLQRGIEWYVRASGDRLFAEAPGPVLLWVGISALVYGPFYLVLAWAFLTGANFVRPAGLVYAGAMTATQLSYLAWALGPGPGPQDPTLFCLLNAPYLVVPAALVVRLWSPAPFGRAVANPGKFRLTDRPGPV